MPSSKNAFTLVELIVVVTIITVLSVVWVFQYTSSSSAIRDATRLTQISELHNGLTSYSLSNRIWDPDNKIDIVSNGKTIWFQWDFGNTLLDSIEYTWAGKDSLTGDYFTILMNSTKNKFQILGYLENEISMQENVSIITEWFANTQFDFPYSYGSKLWIIMDENSQVIHKSEDFVNTQSFDTASQNIPVKIQYSQNDLFEWNMKDLNFYATNLTSGWITASSCKEIKQKLKSAANTNGEYLIEFWDGTIQLVECNMTDNWGGWTRYAEIINEFSFALAEECYNSDWVVKTDGFYCFNPHGKMVNADDLMVQVNRDYASAKAWDQYVKGVSSDFVGIGEMSMNENTYECSKWNNYMTPMQRWKASFDWIVDYYRLGYSFCKSSREPGWVYVSWIMNFSNSWIWPTWWNWVTKGRNSTIVPFTFYYR